MGRRSRAIKERWARRFGSSGSGSGGRRSPEQVRAGHIAELEDRLKELSDGAFETVGDMPPEIRESHL